MQVARVLALPNLSIKPLFVNGVLQAISLAEGHECQEVHENLADQKLEESNKHNQTGRNCDHLSSLENKFKIFVAEAFFHARVRPHKVLSFEDPKADVKLLLFLWLCLIMADFFLFQPIPIPVIIEKLFHAVLSVLVSRGVVCAICVFLTH